MNGYTLTVEATKFVIRRSDGAPVFRLALHDHGYARAILHNLNAQAGRVAA